MIVQILNSFDENSLFSETAVRDKYNVFLAVMKFKSRKGTIRHENGRVYFREGQQSEPKEICGMLTDGYDYVYQTEEGDIIIFNSLARHLLTFGRESVTQEDYSFIESNFQQFKSNEAN